jgi:hypothetical protein
MSDVIWRLSQPKEDPVDELEDGGPLNQPYITDKKVVVFAGHTKWTGQMQKHFPTVTFVESGAAFDYRLIVNADMIFVQTAYIGHKMFYAITSAARKSKTKMYYLSSTGQRICRETMIAEIEKL